MTIKLKDNKKIILLILIVVITILSFLQIKFSMARYIYNSIHNYYLASKGFYFNSDKLSVNGMEVQAESNWSGAETYSITVNLNSKKNDLVFAESDVNYSITFTCSDNIECSLSKLNGTIVGSENGGINEDYFIVKIDPADGNALSSGETAWVSLEATANMPYSQVLTGTLLIGVGNEDITYEIVDSINNPYIEVNITNSMNQTQDVTLQFDPTKVLIDMTNKFLINASNIQTESINGYQYVNEITSSMNSLESITVKFYKIDESQDYTYQIGDEGTPIVTLSYE